MPKKSMTQLRDEALKEVRSVEDRRNRMGTLLEHVVSLVAPSPLVFWLDEARWDTFVELRAATDGDGWDEDVHPFLEKKFPNWKTMYGCLQTRDEENSAVGNPNIVFKDAVVIFDASDNKQTDCVIRVKAGIFEIAMYYEDQSWEYEGRCKTAKDLRAMLKSAGIRMAKT
jgi:hypothetical protein